MNVFHPAAWAGSAFWQPAGEAMLEFLVSGTAVAVIFMLLRRVIGRLPATFRYATASTSLAALVGLAGYHAWEHWPTTPSPSAAVTNDASPSAPFEPRAVSPPAVSAAAVAPAVSITPQPVARFSWEAMKPRLILALPGLWLIGAPLTALFVGLGWTGAARLRRQSTPLIDDTLLARFARCQTLLQVKNVGLAVCETIAAPIVVGVFKPMILLPPALLTSLTCEQWEMILLHELAHVRRFDNLVNLLQRGVETVLFFHPAIWWASRWMRLEREHCCDAVVLRLGTSPQTYAETLAVLALPGIAPQLATAAMANHELLTRMRHILGTEDLPMTISWKKLGLAAVMFAAVGGLIANEWSSSSQQAAADESRQKEMEDKILRRVFTDLAVEPPVLVDYLRTRTGNGRNDSLQAVIKEIERLRAESVYASPADGELARRFSERLIERLNRLHMGEKVVLDLQVGSLPLDASSTQSWSPDQMLGPPDVKEHSDNPKAWAARDPDKGQEWVRLGFERPIKSAAILIYESFNPGAVTSVRVIGPGTPGESIVWDATDAPNPIQSKNVLAIPIKDPSKTPVSAVNIHIDEKRTPGWNEIDAVGLVDAETGETHWATTAQASSTYASVTYGAVLEGRPIGTGPRLNLIVPDKASWSADQALGSPDVPEHSDHPNAWAAREPDKGEEWLQVGFGAEYEPAAIVIHESFNPGAIKAVQFFGHDELSPARTVRLESTPSDGTRVTVVRPVDSGPVEGVRILIDEPKIPGWNEIDAVGLIDAKTGETHWAKVAKASSSFSEVPQFHDSFIFTNVQINQVTDPSWHPRQATGAPNVPEAGDDGRAWASSTQDGQDEWLDLTYNPPVPARAVMVYESYNPGAVRKITVTQTDGRTSVIWDAPDPVRVRDNKGVAVAVVPNDVDMIKSVRIHLDSKSVAGWNEIDAVGLLNGQTGQVQWASDAKASSWFGEQAPHGLPFGAVPSLPVAPVTVDFIDVPIKLPVVISTEQLSWHPSQAAGAPNVHEPRDNPKAWASATPDGQKEWLELTYDPPVLAASMAIYESYNPGAITEVQIEEVDPIADALPAGEGGFRTLMKGNQLYKQGRNGLGITLVTVKTNIHPIRRVRLLIDSPAHQGWNEIDAVGLLSTTGEMHWAKEAKASSWFGNGAATGGGTQGSIEVDAKTTENLKIRNHEFYVGPPSAPSPSGDSSRSEQPPLQIELDAHGVTLLEDRLLDRQQLIEKLKEVQKSPDRKVQFKASSACPYRAVQDVLDVCKSLGLTRYGISISDRERRDVESRFRAIDEVSKLVEEFNDHWDARRFTEALATAMKAREILPTEPAVIMMVEKAKFHFLLEREQALRRESEVDPKDGWQGPRKPAVARPVHNNSPAVSDNPADTKQAAAPNSAEIRKLKLGPGETAEFTMPILGRQTIALPASLKSITDADSRVVEVQTSAVNELHVIGVGLGVTSFEIVLADDSTSKVNIRVSADGAVGTSYVDFRFDSTSVAKSLVILDSLPTDQILEIRVFGTKKVTRNVLLTESSGDPPVAVLRNVPEDASVRMILPIEKGSGTTAQTPKGQATLFSIPDRLTVQQVRILYRSAPGDAYPTPETLGLCNSDASELQWAVEVEPVPKLKNTRPSKSGRHTAPVVF